MSGIPPRAGHLVHGMGTALEEPAWPAITPTEAEMVLRCFPGAGNAVELYWHSPRPFSAASLLRADKGDFLLKRHHRRLRSPESLAQEHAFIAHLRTAGLAVPEIMVSAGNGGTVTQGDWTYELHRKAAGIDLYRDRPSWTAFLSPDHAYAAGEALARLHLASQGFRAPARKPEPLVASFTILPAFDPLAAAEAYIADRPAIGTYLLGKPWRQTLDRLFTTLGNGLSQELAGSAPLWTHNDWHPSNLLWTDDGGICGVIDFGLATRTCALHDLATAIERTSFDWLQLGNGREDRIADPVAATALLAGYRSVLPLATHEMETLVRLLPLVHVEFALSEVDYFAGIMSDPGQAALAWDGYLIGHADWFMSSAGRDFQHHLLNAVEH